MRTIACVQERDILSKGGSLLRAGEQGEPERVYRFMSAHAGHVSVDSDNGPRPERFRPRAITPGGAEPSFASKATIADAGLTRRYPHDPRWIAWEPMARRVFDAELEEPMASLLAGSGLLG